MRLIALSFPLFLLPLVACLAPVVLFRFRRQVVPRDVSAGIFLLLPAPYLAWLITNWVSDRHGSLSNAFFEPLLVGLFMGLVLLPQMLFPGTDKRDFTRRFVTAACTGIVFAIIIGGWIPGLPE